MCARHLLSTLLLAPALMLGQVNANTITVSVSSDSSQQPSQAVFSVVVDSRIDQGIDDIFKALGGSGITAANLTGISGGLSAQASQPPSLEWSFQLTVPIAKIKDTTASLISLQKALVQNGGGLSESFQVSSQISTQAASNCDWAGLIANARAQAQQTAGAAGLAATAIAGVSGSIASATPVCAMNVTFALGYSGNPGPHSITITASRNLNPLPDQVLIGIEIDSGLTTGVDEIMTALSGAGLSGASLSSFNSQLFYQAGVAQPQLVWLFSLPAPLSRLKDTLAQLSAAQQTISKQNAALALGFSVEGVQASQQTPQNCPQSSLIADATTQAQQIATAAGASAGPVLSISTLPTAPAGALVGDFVSASFLLGAITSRPSYTCSLSAQFQMF